MTDAPRPVFLFGAGGHAKVVIDVLRASGRVVLACLAPGVQPGNDILGVPVLEEAAGLESLMREGHRDTFVAIGENAVRVRVAAKARAAGLNVINVVSPHAIVAPDVTLGGGILVVHGVIINASSTIEDDVIINTGASIDHDGFIGAGAHIAPGSHLAGNVTVGSGAFLGIGTIAIPGITVGESAIIGAGSVVVRDIASHARAWGNPAREQSTEGGQPT